MEHASRKGAEAKINAVLRRMSQFNFLSDDSILRLRELADDLSLVSCQSCCAPGDQVVDVS